MSPLKLFEDVWDQPATDEDVKHMKKELSKWGGGIIVLGIIHIVFSGLLDLIWGIIIIGIGILTILIRKRGMYIIIGVALILAGISNCISSVFFMGATFNRSTILSASFIYLFMFGLAQIVWGLFEIKKYKLYKT